MIELPMEDFLNRVVTSEERVQFSQVDPYGHLNASRYSEFIINHRITAVEDQLQVITLDVMKNHGVGFYVSRLDLRYRSPSFLGEKLEISSWVHQLRTNGFDLHMVVSGSADRNIRATALIEIQCVDVKSGGITSCPEKLTSRAEENVLALRPLSSDYLKTLIGTARFK